MSFANKGVVFELWKCWVIVRESVEGIFGLVRVRGRAVPASSPQISQKRIPGTMRGRASEKHKYYRQAAANDAYIELGRAGINEAMSAVWRLELSLVNS